MPALGYYLSTNSTNPETDINQLDVMLTLVRCDINNLLSFFSLLDGVFQIVSFKYVKLPQGFLFCLTFTGL